MSRRDAEALIGVLAAVETQIRGGNVDADVVDHLRQRLLRDGAIAEPGEDDVGEALARLNHAVRTALGEYD